MPNSPALHLRIEWFQPEPPRIFGKESQGTAFTGRALRLSWQSPCRLLTPARFSPAAALHFACPFTQQNL